MPYDEEFIEGLVAVAVPICDPQGRFCAGLAVHAPKFRMTMEDAIARLPELRAAAGQIEAQIADDSGDLGQQRRKLKYS